MSHLGEEAEAFFKKGDEGTYEGGPRSLTPTSSDLPVEENESLTAELIADQLERRTRMQHLVTKIVGGLGVGLLLLLSVRLGASRTADRETTESLGSMAPRTHATPSPLAAAPVGAPARGAGPAAPVAAAPVVAAPPPPAPTAAPIASVRSSARASGVTDMHPSPAARAHAKHASAVHSQQQGNRPSSSVTMPTRTVATVPLSRGHRLPGTHVPPTATFPD